MGTFDSTKTSLYVLLNDVHNGKIQLPDFQRGWVWDDNRIKGIIASVAKSFPIGAVMLLETGNETVRFKTKPVEGVKNKNGIKPEYLILDRQLMKYLIILLFSLSPYLLCAQSANLDALVCPNYDQQVFKDPVINYGIYKSFTLISTNQFLKKEEQSMLEKQLEFFLFNYISYGHYLKYIPLSDSTRPDLLIVYDYNNDYKEVYIAPKSYSIPYWQQGSTSTTNINSNASGSLNVTGDLNMTVDGYGTKQSTMTTSTSGIWTTRQVQRSGYIEGKFFPYFSFVIFDTSNDKKIWEASATGTSDSKDFRIPGQVMMTRLGYEIPSGSFVDEELIRDNDGKVGIQSILYNTEGRDFYPVIVEVSDNTPASKNGIKFGDVIIAINDIPTANMTKRNIQLLFKGNAGTKITLTIERKGKILRKTLIKAKKV
jgi:hypothetical protein